MLGSGSVTISGTGQVANMLVMIQQSTDGGNTWNDFAPTLTDNSTKYQVSAAAPPAFGTVWYRANFTGIVPTDAILQSIKNGTTPLDMAKFQEIQSTSDDWLNGRILWLPTTAQPQVTDPIAVSSSSTDAMVVAVPIVIIIIAVVGAVVWRSKKKSSSTAK
jgi:hypothetical protein